MISSLKWLPVIAGLGSLGFLCPLCGEGPAVAQAESLYLAAVDTAVVRLHISGMTCGSCPATARLALKKLAGIHSAAVTLDDSLGIVSYDPERVTPEQIVAHLTRATGFGATILPAPSNRPRRSEGA